MRLPGYTDSLSTRRLPVVSQVTMLYLEDYLEMIEQLHHDLRDQFTVMRELDLNVQTDYETVQQDISVFCERAKSMTPDEWGKDQIPIINSFMKMMETADEKVSLSTTLHASVSRYLQKLEKELSKFKAELEADNEGITEVLEQMAMVEESAPESPKPMKKKNALYESNSFDNFSDYDMDGSGLGGLEGLDEYRMLYEDLNNQEHSPQSITSDTSDLLNLAARKRKREKEETPTSVVQTLNPVDSRPTNPVVKKKRPAMFGPGSGNPPPQGMQTASSSQIRLNKKLEYQSSQEVFEVDWQYVDPNEPRYCICNQVSYGDMVGCDNPSCPIEWFHYPCVGLTDAPKGKWYCPQCCNETMKRKK